MIELKIGFYYIPFFKILLEINTTSLNLLLKNNNNKIVIPYDSDKDLERILEILNIEIED